MKVDYKEKIIDKSINLFLKYGISETGVADIAKAVGISKGTLYYHFKNKDALVLEIARRYFDNMDNVLSDFLENNLNKINFTSMAGIVVNIIKNNQEVEKLNYVLLAYGVIKLPELSEMFRVKYQEWIEKLYNALESIDSENPCNRMYSQLIFSAIAGLAIRNVLGMDNIDIDKNQLSTMIDRLRTKD